MHTVRDPEDLNRFMSSDFTAHTYALLAQPDIPGDPYFKLLNPNLNRSPDPSFAELHPYELRPTALGPNSPKRAEPARTNSPRGFRSVGELRQVDHRPPTTSNGLFRERPDVRADNQLDFVRGWRDAFGLPSEDGEFPLDQLQGTAFDLKSDSEAFSAFAMAGTNAGSAPFWPFRQKTRRSMIRQPLLGNISGSPPVGQFGPWLEPEYFRESLRKTNPDDPDIEFGRYQSPYERTDYLLTEAQPVQPSVTSPADVSGNWSGVLDGSGGSTILYQDSAGGAIEDANLLVAGAANLVTTRSDTFVAHFRVRSFKQNTETGIWDATDPRFIVDERRFVMLVDRSQVDEPGQQPDILFFEETPN